MSSPGIQKQVESNLSALYERHLFTPCETKEELRQWISTFLGIDFPDYTVDPNSNSNPLEFIWDVYESALTANPNKTTFVAAASRNCAKTLGVSVLEFLLMLHFGKTIVHLAAILDQSQACISYLNNFLRIPVVQKYSKTDSSRRKLLSGLPDNPMRSQRDAKLQVIVANKESANGQRGNVLCLPGTSKICVKSKTEKQTKHGSIRYQSAESVYKDVTANNPVYVQTVNEKTLQLEFKVVEKAWRRKKLKRLKITTNTGAVITCTEEHPIATKYNGCSMDYTPANDLKIGDNLILKRKSTEGGVSSRLWQKTLCTEVITSIETVSVEENTRSAWVYDFQVQDNHNFFCKRFLVHNCFDETDLIDENVLSESAMIADPDRKGNPPIFIYVSSRKSAHGPMQDKIDASTDPDSGIKLHKWSLADFMKKCDEHTYGANTPKVNMYIHEDKLIVKNQEDYDECLDTEREMYDEVNVHQGCVTCPALIVCRGWAAKQKSTPTNMLRDIPYVRTLLRETKDPEKINAQLRNTKPESSGTVFNKFSQEQHFRPINEVYKFAFGLEWEESPDYTGKKLDKITFSKLLRKFGSKLHCGVDFGYIDTAVGLLVAYNRSQDKCVVIHTEFATGYANRDWLRHIKKTIYLPYGFNLCCPDIADRSSPSMCSKLQMPARSKKPAKIDTGVHWIRARLWDAESQEARCMIIADDKNKYLVKCMEKWQYKKTTMGFMYDQYDEESPYTHPIDAWRYAIDPFIMANEFTANSDQAKQQIHPIYTNQSEIDQLEHQLHSLRSQIHDHFNDEFSLNLPVNKSQENDNEDTFADESNFMFTF